jgi:hypothetical protein
LLSGAYVVNGAGSNVVRNGDWRGHGPRANFDRLHRLGLHGGHTGQRRRGLALVQVVACKLA